MKKIKGTTDIIQHGTRYPQNKTFNIIIMLVLIAQ